VTAFSKAYKTRKRAETKNVTPFSSSFGTGTVSCILTGYRLATGKVKPQEPSLLLDSPATLGAESRLLSAEALYSLLLL